jgi:rSAM/selenodomain-associated transferase 2
MGKSISIIIPVWNETSVIDHSVERILSHEYDDSFEVIVVDGSPEGETVLSMREEKVKKLTAGRGRSRQMNKGAHHAEGEVLLFLHADTVLPENGLEEISAVMEKGDVVAGAFDLGIDSERPLFRLIENAASLRSRITRMPYGDQAIFVRSDYFRAMGGFREIPLMEDVDLMRRIKKAGDRICFIGNKVRTSPRRWEREGLLYCTLRNWTLISLYFLGVSPERLAKFYRSG